MGSNTDRSNPRISVVVASKVGAPFIDQCLNSLAKEAAELEAEVIVVAAGQSSYAAHLAAAFPWTKVVHAADLSKVPALRRRGVDEAKAEIVAIIEEHCSAAPDWLNRALAAHSTGIYGAVGGPIVDYDYSRLRDWVVYFLEYNGALPPYPRGETFELNDANIAYRRESLISHRNLLNDGYWPMTMHPTLISKGIKLLSVPDMIVHHRGPFNFGYYLHQRYLFSRAFAGVRAEGQSAVRRAAYLAGAPVVPIVLLARMASRVVQKRCRVGKFVATLPLMIPALIVFVAGEWVGYLLGPGDALSKVE
jgi:glycosyltransferase involved in cell wall biosynthesis